MCLCVWFAPHPFCVDVLSFFLSVFPSPSFSFASLVLSLSVSLSLSHSLSLFFFCFSLSLSLSRSFRLGRGTLNPRPSTSRPPPLNYARARET